MCVLKTNDTESPKGLWENLKRYYFTICKNITRTVLFCSHLQGLLL